ncbi:MAG TPA: sulfate ABC transporter permease subunit CysW [Thermoanaerobaculia bacterium]|nr:sulfate ABC transporter permease subunit CysW [Thermoanaerobaculia bacterium]
MNGPPPLPWTFPRRLLLGVALAFLILFLGMPLAVVFVSALSGGLTVFAKAISDPDARAAIRLTLTVVAATVPVNLVFGLAAGWAIGKFRFRGRNFLASLIDLPFAVSPVVAGMVFVLLFGAHGWFGPWLAERELRIIFALPGIVLATVFVTAPLIARELAATLENQGNSEEEAALTLGASGWQMFFAVSLPKLKWSLLYGLVLTTARALGEFGAVSVVSGHIRGKTNTLPLHVEILYNEYQFQAAFAVASLLALSALVSIAAKSLLEARAHRPERAVS